MSSSFFIHFIPPNLFTLAPGDLIFTGTPAGVSSIQPGDFVEGGVDGVGEISITVT